jgi:hypothetical protein
MALIVQTGNSIGSGVRVSLITTADTYVDPVGISVISSDGSDAIASSVSGANDQVQISGEVTGGNGIDFTATGFTTTLYLTVNATGSVSGFNSYGVQALGVSIITNYGAIEGTSDGANLFYGTVYNYGTISSTGIGDPIAFSGQGALYNFGTLSGVNAVTFGINSAANYFYNSGTIRGGVVDDSNNAFNTDVLYNFGTITSLGYSFFGGGSEKIDFINAGSMTGNVITGTGIFDSTLGQVFGTIQAGPGGATIVGGTNGGTVYGNTGNDILYANRTKTAADGGARTTLDGAGGINALYGDGAFTTFMAGDSGGGYNQIWGGASQMTGVGGYTNNALSFAGAAHGVYVDLLAGHDAYVSNGTNWTGSGVFEDSIVNVPNVIGSAQGDLIQADNGIDRITGGGGADQLYAGSGAGSQDTFVYTAYGDSNLVTGYDTIVGFKIGTDKIDLSAMHTDASHLAISTGGTSNTLYLEQTPGTFNANTDLAMVVGTTTTGGLQASDFVF